MAIALIKYEQLTRDQRRTIAMLTSTSGQPTLKCYVIANFCKIEQYSRKRLTNKHNRITIGDIVSAVVKSEEDSNIVRIAEFGNGRKMFFKVYSIIEKNGLLWIGVRKLPNLDGDRQCIIDDSGPLKVMRLTPSVRHAAHMHVCTDRCKTVMNGLQIILQHDDTEKMYRVIGQEDGFPPHMV